MNRLTLIIPWVVLATAGCQPESDGSNPEPSAPPVRIRISPVGDGFGQASLFLIARARWLDSVAVACQDPGDLWLATAQTNVVEHLRKLHPDSLITRIIRIRYEDRDLLAEYAAMLRLLSSVPSVAFDSLKVSPAGFVVVPQVGWDTVAYAIIDNDEYLGRALQSVTIEKGGSEQNVAAAARFSCERSLRLGPMDSVPPS